jgi:S1-C subfamily serine protease
MQDDNTPNDQDGFVTITPAGGKPVAAAREPAVPKPAALSVAPARSAPGGASTGAGASPGVRLLSKVAAWSAVGVLVIGAGFGVFAASGGLAHAKAAPSAAIPFPPKANPTFVEDDDDVGQDNQENILQATAPGLVQIVASSGAPVGSGVVITPSGKVLTSDQVLSGAGAVTARFALAGALFRARVIGTDPAAGLALLQLVGGGGRPFPTAKVGNSANFTTSAARAQIASWHVGQGTGFTVTALGSSSAVAGATLDVGTLTSLGGAATVGGQRLTGLLQTTAQVIPGQETGGPLVALAGQVIGIDVAGAGGGLHNIGYAVPINQALAIARIIDRRH